MSQIDALPRPARGKNVKRRDGNFARALGGLIAVSMVYSAVAMGSDAMIFLNLPSFILVICGSYFIGIAAYGWRDFNSGVKALLSPYRANMLSSLHSRHVGIIRSMRTFVFLSATLATFIGMVQMLAALDDPSAIGPALAVALLSILYSVALILLVIQPALCSLENHLHNDQAGE